jgi:hypothetical protein
MKGIRDNLTGEGHSPVTKPEKSYKSRFNPATLSYTAVDDTPQGVSLDVDSSLESDPLISTNPLGTTDDDLIGTHKDISLVTFDNLLASTGLTENKADSTTRLKSEHIKLPESLPRLLKVIGDFADGHKDGVLRNIASDTKHPSRTRAMAISSLARFGRNSETTRILNAIVRDINESHAVREVSLNVLVDIDGPQFEKFFVESCLNQLKGRSDRRLGQLLMLAAYRDVELYNGRSLRKVLRELEPYTNQSSMIAGLCSIKLRMKDYDAPDHELKGYSASHDVVVLSSLVNYLARNAGKNEFAQKLLSQTARESNNPQIRKLAHSALSTLKAN